MLNFGSYILYLLLLTIRYSTFWFYLRYKNKYVLFDFYFAKFNFLHFISTPSNHSPICVWFYLRYKNKKNYTKLSLVLSRCFEGCEFPLSFSFSVFLLLLDRNLLPGFSTNYAQFHILYQLWTVHVPPVPYVVHIVGFLGCVTLFNFIGEYCESIPLNRTGSYVLSA